MKPKPSPALVLPEQQQQQPQPLQHVHIRGPDWFSQEWLLCEISYMLGTEEMLQRACNVCRVWRRWCDTDVMVLDIGSEFGRLYSVPEGARTSTGLSIPLFLPIVPLSLQELSLSGDWTTPTPRELATIRRGCRLRKLVMTGVRLFSFSYRELMLFEHLEELDVSDSFMDVPLPRLRFAEPGGESRFARKTSSSSSKSAAARLTPPLRAHPRPPRAPPSGRVAVPLSKMGDGEVGAFDSPRFAHSLRKLTATKTRLWARWDLSAFPVLTALEVSYAGRTLLQQLHRKAEMGSRLAELSVCDLALRNLVDAFEMQELAEAVGGVSTFRLRRVDVVKEVASFAYLRAILSRLHNLQVLELTDVGLDDSMLSALGGCLSSASGRSSANGGGRGGNTGGNNGPASMLTLDGWAAAEGRTGAGARTSIISLRTLILGNCGGVSERALEEFLAIVGQGEGVGRAGTKAGVGRGDSGGGVVGVSVAGVRDAAGSGASVRSLSSVRLQECKALGDRGLAALCGGTRGGLVDLQVSGSSLLTDSGVEALAKACPRLTHVDVSGCLCVTSNALSFLLAKCPVLRVVKAWGVRVAGNPGCVVKAWGVRIAGKSGGVAREPSAALAARTLREAYERRNVEFLWAGLLSDKVVEAKEGREETSNSDESGGYSRKGRGEENVARERERRQPCVTGCGASLMRNDIEDHSEICMLAPVACLMRMDGCAWTGTRLERRRHHKCCPMWRVKCPVCCQAVHATDFSEHVLSHSASSEAPALHPPGCALRAYGCRACRTSLDPTASTAINSSEMAGSLAAAGKEHAPLELELAASRGKDEGCDRDREGGDMRPGQRGKARDGNTAGHLLHDNLERCPWYRLMCPSCDREISREEWDKGMHACPSHRKVDMLAWHFSGAGMLRNRRWLQLVYGYIGGGSWQNGIEGINEPRYEAFHGVNPMCAMPSMLSSALPLPGPASSSASSPATPPP